MARKIDEAERKLADALPEEAPSLLETFEALRSLEARFAPLIAERHARERAEMASIRAQVCGKQVVNFEEARAAMRPRDWGQS
ncbi:MAG: hypothetical protein ACR65X_13070 [Methylocystis sp.]